MILRQLIGESKGPCASKEVSTGEVSVTDIREYGQGLDLVRAMVELCGVTHLA